MDKLQTESSGPCTPTPWRRASPPPTIEDCPAHPTGHSFFVWPVYEMPVRRCASVPAVCGEPERTSKGLAGNVRGTTGERRVPCVPASPVTHAPACVRGKAEDSSAHRTLTPLSVSPCPPCTSHSCTSLVYKDGSTLTSGLFSLTHLSLLKLDHQFALCSTLCLCHLDIATTIDEASLT